MIKINTILNNKEWNNYIKNPSIFVEKKINRINKNFKKYKDNKIFCTLLLSGNNEIKKLNKKFRKKNKSTDVLSFPFYNIKEFKKQKKGIIYLGDVILNFNMINKKDFKNDFDRLWVHGFLHLMGYKHFTNKDYKKMNKMEISILKKIRKN